jgi:hypothetical protein
MFFFIIYHQKAFSSRGKQKIDVPGKDIFQRSFQKSFEKQQRCHSQRAVKGSLNLLPGR